MTGLTFITVAAAVYGLLSRRGYGPALALGGATPAGAAFVVGAVAVPTFYALAMGALILVLLRDLRAPRDGVLPHDRQPVPASGLLILFVAVCTVTTLAAPMLFGGTETIGASGTEQYLTPGVVTKSNIAQMLYLLLGAGVVAYIARSHSAGPQIVGLAAGAVVMLSLWAHLHTTIGAPFPEGLFDNSPTFNYIDTLPGGEARVRGILSEPAGLAASCIVMIAYGSSRVWQVTGVRRAAVLTITAVAAYLGTISTSTTFAAAGVALTLIAILVGASKFLLTGSLLSRPRAAGLVALAVAGLWVVPPIATEIGQQFTAKMGTSSYADRTSADAESYRILLETYGLGAGLGASRGSSFVTTLLSTVGLVGAILFGAVILILLTRTWSVPSVRPAAWALIALLVCKVISSPDLSDTSGILWLSLGVLAHAAVRKSARDDSDAALATMRPNLGRSNGHLSRDGEGVR